MVGPTINGESILLLNRSPELSVQTLGPKQITLGKEAVYKLVVSNVGDHAANDVRLSVTLPQSAEVVEARATEGSCQGDKATGGNCYQWQIRNLAGRSRSELTLRIVPRKNEPFDLAMSWTCAAATAEARVEVREPKLNLVINGPADVTYGEQKLYRLTLSNPGTGDAENTTIHLLPLTPGESATASQNIGALKAGEERVIEVELTARQAGQLHITAKATADGDLYSEATQPVLVRRAELEVSVTGPRMHYAGLPANFEVRVKNSGDAPARDVRVAASLPPQSELLSVEGGQAATGNEQVSWQIAELAPGAEQTLPLVCVLKSAGDHRLAVASEAAGDLKSAADIATQVLARADLTLQVADTPGPVPVGKDVVYEVHIRNRGTKASGEVEIAAYFSDGIEPIGVEGGDYDLAPGMVTLRPIPSVAAGAERIVKIKARADAAGNHRLRVELQCKALGTRLTQEDTTFFYTADDGAATP